MCPFEQRKSLYFTSNKTSWRPFHWINRYTGFHLVDALQSIYLVPLQRTWLMSNLVITHICHYVNMQTGECLKWLMLKAGENLTRGAQQGCSNMGDPVDFGCCKCVVVEIWGILCFFANAIQQVRSSLGKAGQVGPLRMGFWQADLRAGQQARGMKTWAREWFKCWSKSSKQIGKGVNKGRGCVVGRKFRVQWARVLMSLKIQSSGSEWELQGRSL